jgi:hypothetical protein
MKMNREKTYVKTDVKENGEKIYVKTDVKENGEKIYVKTDVDLNKINPTFQDQPSMDFMTEQQMIIFNELRWEGSQMWSLFDNAVDIANNLIQKIESREFVSVEQITHALSLLRETAIHYNNVRDQDINVELNETACRLYYLYYNQ